MPLSCRPAIAGVGMLRRRIVVAPVDQGGDAVIELVQRAGQGGDVDILGLGRRSPARHGRGGITPAGVQLAATEAQRVVCCGCMWALISPGSTKRPLQSIVSAPFWRSGTGRSGPTAAMRSPSISTSPSGSTPSAGSCVTTMPDFRSLSMVLRPRACLAPQQQPRAVMDLLQPIAHLRHSPPRASCRRSVPALAAARRNRYRRDTGARVEATLSRVTEAVGMTTPNRLGRAHGQLHVLQQQLGREGRGEVEIAPAPASCSACTSSPARSD